jgi:hypothetical protein
MNSDDIIEVPALPSHAQYTEYYVQAVKRGVVRHIGHDSQDVHIKGKILGRRLNTNLDQRKSEYQLIGNLADQI